MAFQLTEQQNSVLQAVKDFLNSDAAVFILKGYAGTGKTTMIRQIAEYIMTELHRQPELMAPTGRAARVLSKKSGFDATTIHRRIYDRDDWAIKKVNNVSDSEFKIIFHIRKVSTSVLAIVDEASMVSSQKSELELFQFGSDILLDDLLTYVRPSYGGKIIFVGDPAQLPPVGDSHSCALDEDYFSKKGLKCSSAELTQVLRQGGDSTILKNAMKIRNILQTSLRNGLTFEMRNGEVESVEPQDVVTRYMETGADAASGKSVVIAFSNRQVAEYNKEIRIKKYKKELPLQPGDSLMVVKNNYYLTDKDGFETQLMNGDFIKVLECGDIEQKMTPVYVQKGGKKEKKSITLTFQNAIVLDNENKEIYCKLIVDLLNNDQPSLTIDEQRALYINFRIRNPKLRPGSDLFLNALEQDPYYNALQVKYGYAITGHKCQGGEWQKVFVDYQGRTGLNDDCLRWNYTATTRAQETLYVTNLPNITPFDKFRIDAVTSISKINPEFRTLGKVGDLKFHAPTDEDFLCAKEACIVNNLEYSPYSVINITSKPYREIYEIETPDGTERYDLMYKSSGAFLPAKTLFPTQHTVLIETMLNDEHCMPIEFHYVPSDNLHWQLFGYINSACDDLGIKISNVVEHNDKHYTMFYLCTSGTYSYLQVYIDKKGFVTYAKPASFLGKEDRDLMTLVELLRR